MPDDRGMPIPKLKNSFNWAPMNGDASSTAYNIADGEDGEDAHAMIRAVPDEGGQGLYMKRMITPSEVAVRGQDVPTLPVLSIADFRAATHTPEEPAAPEVSARTLLYLLERNKAMQA
jgi:hypothetical protein